MHDPESEIQEESYRSTNSFSEKRIRLGFIRKVYSILSVQILITVGIIAVFLFVEPVKKFSQENTALLWVAFVLTFMLMMVLACCENVRRKHPINLILLIAFTLLEGFLLGSVSTHYGRDEVFMAAGITAVVTVVLTCFAFQTKWDFTVMRGMLAVSVIVLIVFGILAIFIRNRIVSLVVASLGALLFSMYIVFDTQKMMGGDHEYSLSPEDYVFAALSLYIDIINLFLCILRITGLSGSRDN